MPTNGINATPGGVSTTPPMVSNPYTPSHADIVSPLITIPSQALALGGTLTNYEALIKTQFLQHESLIQVPVDANATAGNVLINAALFNEYTHKLHRLYVLLHDRAFGAMEYRITLFGASTIIGALEVGTTLYYMDTPRINDLRVIEGKTIQANGTNVYTFTLGPTVPEDGIQRNFWPTHAQGQNDTFKDITTLDFSKFPHFVIIQNVPLQTNITSSVTNIYIRIESRMSQDFCVALTNISRLENIFDYLTANTTQNNITSKSVVNNKDFRSLFNNEKRLYISKDGLFTVGETNSNTLLTPSSYLTDQDTMTTMPTRSEMTADFILAPDGYDDFVYRGSQADLKYRAPYYADIQNGRQSVIQCGQSTQDPYAPFILHLSQSSDTDPLISASIRVRCLVYGDPTLQTNWIRMINGDNSIKAHTTALTTTLNNLIGTVTGMDTASKTAFLNNFVLEYAKAVVPVSTDVSLQLITSVVVPAVESATKAADSILDTQGDTAPYFSSNGIIVSDGNQVYTIFFYMTFTQPNIYYDITKIAPKYTQLYTLTYGDTSTIDPNTYERTYLNYRQIHWITPVALEDISYTVASFIRPPVFTQYKKVPEGFVRLIVTTKIPPSVATAVAIEGIPTTGSLMPNFATQSNNEVFVFDLVTPNNLQTVMKVAYAVEYQTFYAQFTNSSDWYSTYNTHSAADLIVRNFVTYTKGNVPNMSRIADFVTRVITDPDTSLFMSSDINGPYITRVPLKFLSN